MKPNVLVIMDGVGMRKETVGNAVKAAKMNNFNNLAKTYPHSLLQASGTYVGLPDDQMGNSEVGHQAIGSGRIIKESLMRINQGVETDELKNNKELLKLFKHVKKKKSKLHYMGLLSDGGVHSHINHLLYLIDKAKENNITQLYFHVFLDGRDTAPNSAKQFLDILNNKIKESEIGSIATISGRFYAMDRDNRWERIEKAYKIMVEASGYAYNSYDECLETSYANGITDEFIEPTIIDETGLISNNDGILLFNFRPDRARELFSALTNKKIKAFERKELKNIKLVTMYPVADIIGTNIYEKENITNTLGIVLANSKKKQLRIAETEKYAHVTYFFDGGKEMKLKKCDRILIPSPKVETYDLKPEMSAIEITEKVLLNIGKYDFIVVNYANGDMVGHTGNMDATIKALEVVDECLGKIYDKVKELDGTLFICSDHGNSDYMLDGDRIITSHSKERVPFIITKENIKLSEGALENIAPTILEIMNLKKPKEMSNSLIIKEQ